jgi:hypothetical protein
MAQSQFDQLRERRFAPYFIVTLLGAFNDNVFRQSIIALLEVDGAGRGDGQLHPRHLQAAGACGDHPAVIPVLGHCGPDRGHLHSS